MYIIIYFQKKIQQLSVNKCDKGVKNLIVNFCNDLPKNPKVFQKNAVNNSARFIGVLLCIRCGPVVIVLETKSRCLHFGSKNKQKL